MAPTTLLLLSIAIPFIVAQVPTSPGCTGDCATDFAIGYDFDSRSWVSTDIEADPFYMVPSNTTAAVPGDLIKWESVSPDALLTNWTVPGGTSLFRFLYLTEDVDRKPIPASAYALLPYGAPRNASALRTIVWAHGTAGIAQVCAPSNHRNLYYEWSAPYSYAQAGYAVIAPDYAGMGSHLPQGFMYMAGSLHAADVAYSLVAARKQLGKVLTDEWVTIGQSEGGMVAWRTNQRLARSGQDALLKAGKFLGAVSIAPSNRPLDFMTMEDTKGLGIYILESLAKLYPDQVRLEDYLTPMALGRVPLMDASCVYGSYFLLNSINRTQIYRDNASIPSDVAQDWKKRYMADAPNPLAAPMLVIQGTEDIFVPGNETIQEFKDLCRANPNSTVQLNIYVAQDHDVVTTSTQPDYLGWVSDRFDGVPLKSGCSTYEFQPWFENFNVLANVYRANE